MTEQQPDPSGIDPINPDDATDRDGQSDDLESDNGLDPEAGDVQDPDADDPNLQTTGDPNGADVTEPTD